MKNKEIKFNTMPSQKNLKIFILDRIKHQYSDEYIINELIENECYFKDNGEMY